MSLREKINEQFKIALKSKNKTLVSTLRLVLTAIKERDIANRTSAKKEDVKDTEIVKVLRRMKKQRQESANLYKQGGLLGFISGVVGIGGGIFLSPILFLIKAGRPKHIVTTASLFILINSILGIIGQLTKNEVLAEISNYWYLLVAVLVGGQIGNFLNLKIFPTRVLALLTALLIIFVAARIGFRIFF